MRMLITIFSIIFILGTQNVVYALATATTCGTKTSSTSCNATAGCYWNNRTCSQCPGGTYKEPNDTSCNQCPTNLLGDGVTWDTSILGQTSQNECHWTSTCDQSGQYTDPTGGCKYCQEKNDPNTNTYYYLKPLKTQTGTLDGTDYFSTYCGECGQNTQPTSNGDQACVCKTGYIREDNTTDNNSADCTAKTYKINYMCGNERIFAQQYADIEHPCIDDNTIKFIYYGQDFKIPTFLTSKSGVSTDSASQISRPKCLLSDDSLPYDTTPKNECKKTGHNLIGWHTEDKAIIFKLDASDTLPEDLQSGNIFTSNSHTYTWQWDKSLTVYPIWALKKFKCDKGYFFEKENEKEECSPCKPGYYCPGFEETDYADADMGINNCPFGSTSDTKSDAITDCYLKPAVKCEASSDAITDCYSGTKFCGASTGDCIYMPASAEPAYYTGTTGTSAQ